MAMKPVVTDEDWGTLDAGDDKLCGPLQFTEQTLLTLGDEGNLLKGFGPVAPVGDTQCVKVKPIFGDGFSWGQRDFQPTRQQLARLHQSGLASTLIDSMNFAQEFIVEHGARAPAR